jgi:hypothetical protein
VAPPRRRPHTDDLPTIAGLSARRDAHSSDPATVYLSAAADGEPVDQRDLGRAAR